MLWYLIILIIIVMYWVRLHLKPARYKLSPLISGAAVGVAEKEVPVESSRTQIFCSTLLTAPMS